jgi:hypothetical protein
MNEHASKNAHAFLTAYSIVAAAVFPCLGGAYLNVYRRDPWLTPRFTPEILLFCQFRDVLGRLPKVGVFLGAVTILAEPRLRKSRLLWGGLALFAASGYCLYSGRGL